MEEEVPKPGLAYTRRRRGVLQAQRNNNNKKMQMLREKRETSALGRSVQTDFIGVLTGKFSSFSCFQERHPSSLTVADPGAGFS